MLELVLARYLYVLILVLLAIGLYGVLARDNLVKKIIGLTIFSTAIYLFFIEGSVQIDATVPILDGRGSDPALYVDPLPHLLILTAIVVGVGVTGVALALVIRLYRAYGSLSEMEISAILDAESAAAAHPATEAAAGTASEGTGPQDPVSDADGGAA
jgi:multicomponent Na+:H+ antiporter subunit C